MEVGTAHALHISFSYYHFNRSHSLSQVKKLIFLNKKNRPPLVQGGRLVPSTSYLPITNFLTSLGSVSSQVVELL